MLYSIRGVLPQSDIFFSTPSTLAAEVLYYPLSCGHFYCKEGYQVCRERDESILIAGVLGGSLTLRTDGQEQTANAGDIAVIDCYRPHQYGAYGTLEFIWTHVSGATAPQMARKMIRSRGNVLSSAGGHPATSRLGKLVEHFESGGQSNEFALSSEIHRLLCTLLEPAPSKNTPGLPYASALTDLCAYIDEHLDQPLSVGILAAQIPLSPSHFSKIFRRYMGFSPYDYIRSRRITRAKELLLRSEMSVCDIAAATGFSSESNFFKAFRASSGSSPLHFRKTAG